MKIVIETDLTSKGTILTVDGVKVTDTDNITSLSFWAHSPYKDSPNQDGYVDLGYSAVDASGITTRKDICKSSYDIDKKGLGKIDDCATDIDDFLGKDNNKKDHMIDLIIKQTTTGTTSKYTKDALTKRSINSLRDTMEDLGLKIE